MYGFEASEWEGVCALFDVALSDAQALGVENAQTLIPSLRLRLPVPCTPEALLPLRLSELLLTEACVAQRPGALESFDRRFLMPVVEQVSRRHTHLEANELAQAVRERLFVGAGLQRLRAWRGHGSLTGWLRSVATRVALNARTADMTDSLDDARWECVVRRLSAPGDPELALIERSRTLELQAALRDALRRLPQREKVVLRLHVFDELSTEQLGRMFKVNPATARRWIQGARETVLASVRETLAGAAKWSASQVESALKGLGSSPDLGLSGLD